MAIAAILAALQDLSAAQDHALSLAASLAAQLLASQLAAQCHVILAATKQSALDLLTLCAVEIEGQRLRVDPFYHHEAQRRLKGFP